MNARCAWGSSPGVFGRVAVIFISSTEGFGIQSLLEARLPIVPSVGFISNAFDLSNSERDVYYAMIHYITIYALDSSTTTPGI